ncbi:MAG TPA: DUF4097 family beta strand repeat-containing protein [Acidobacteriota bacterium]|nr:DUF4097 family beta strand repeat-containing protein [Acidobacteriota bacterium]
MLASLAFAALTAFSLSADADTTIAVTPDMTLRVANYAGSVVIETWNKDAVRIEATHSEADKIWVRTVDGALLVKTTTSPKAQRSADIHITAPAWMSLEVSGTHTDVAVDGTRGALRVTTVHGDVEVAKTTGRVVLNTVNRDIRVIRSGGTIVTESVNGDCELRAMEADTVDASTVNGSILYEGVYRPNGRYRFASHHGDVAAAIPTACNATVAVSTFSGNFSSAFPVSVSEAKRGRRFQFSLGDGRARIELKSFQGTIHLYRAGSPAPIRVRPTQSMIPGESDIPTP